MNKPQEFAGKTIAEAVALAVDAQVRKEFDL